MRKIVVLKDLDGITRAKHRVEHTHRYYTLKTIMATPTDFIDRKFFGCTDCYEYDEIKYEYYYMETKGFWIFKKTYYYYRQI